MPARRHSSFQAIITGAALGLLLTNQTNAFVVESFDPAVVFSGTDPAAQAALDAATGVTGFVLEDFEDINLIPGLTIETSGFPATNVLRPSGDIVTTSNPIEWDGISHLSTNLRVGDTIFRFPAGANSIGLGLSDIDDTDVRLMINGFDFGLVRDLPNYVRLADAQREVYFRVDREPGDPPITEILIGGVVGISINEGVGFDHLMIRPQAPNHFQCYRVREETDIPDQFVSLDDQFGSQSDIKIKKAKILCVPVDKNGEGIEDPSLSYVCYNTKSKANPKQDALADNQFGQQELRVKKADLLCVPSAVEVLGDTQASGNDE